MKIAQTAFSGSIMKAFNGRAISPAMSDADTPIKGATDTYMYYMVDEQKGSVMQTQALFLINDQISN